MRDERAHVILQMHTWDRYRRNHDAVAAACIAVIAVAGGAWFLAAPSGSYESLTERMDFIRWVSGAAVLIGVLNFWLEGRKSKEAQAIYERLAADASRLAAEEAEQDEADAGDEGEDPWPWLPK